MAADKHEEGNPPVSWPRRIGWLVGIWLASVASLGLLAWLLRQFMAAAGLVTPG